MGGSEEEGAGLWRLRVLSWWGQSPGSAQAHSWETGAPGDCGGSGGAPSGRLLGLLLPWSPKSLARVLLPTPASLISKQISRGPL